MKFEINKDLLISQVDLWNVDQCLRNKDVIVKNGYIESIVDHQPKSSSAGFIDARGLTLIPAGVDAQVHLRVPGQEHKETAETAINAAIAGGIGAMLTMPNTNPVLDNPKICQQAAGELEKHMATSGVKILLSAAMTRGQKGQVPVDFAELAKYGVTAFTDDGFGIESTNIMDQVFAASAKLHLPVLQHAEIPGHGCSLAAGPLQQRLGMTAYPQEAETDMVARDLARLKQYPQARYHVLHVSCADTVRMVSKARSEGLLVSCEVSPHHLFFSSHDIDPNNTSFKMNPPLRSPEDRTFLRQALADGRIDFVATDHAPHESAAKDHDFATAAFGTLGLETSLRVLIDLWQKKILSQTRLVEVFSHSPAQFLGIDDQFGYLEVGRPMNAVLIDPQAPSNLISANFNSLSQNSCFIGSTLPDSLKATFLQQRLYRTGIRD